VEIPEIKQVTSMTIFINNKSAKLHCVLKDSFIKEKRFLLSCLTVYTWLTDLHSEVDREVFAVELGATES